MTNTINSKLTFQEYILFLEEQMPWAAEILNADN